MNGPENRCSISDLRGRIDHLDWMIRRLVERRVSTALSIIEQKKSVETPEREEEILRECDTQLQRDVQRRLIEEAKRRALDGDHP